MPMAPAPTTTRRLGAAVSANASRLVMILVPSIVMPGSERGRAPVAMMMLDASRIWPDGSTRTCLRAQERGGALDVRHTVLLEQEADPLDQPVGHLAAALVGHRVVQLEILEAEPELLALAGQDAGQLRIAQQRLGRDAAPVQTDAAQRFALDAGHLLAQLRRPNRGHVAARPAADDNDVVCVVGHEINHSWFVLRVAYCVLRTACC